MKFKIYKTRNDKDMIRKIILASLITSTLCTATIPVYATGPYDDMEYKGKGYIMTYREVGPNGTGKTISTGKGDAGGKSYGLCQYSSVAGSADEFISWLKENDPEYYKFFEEMGNPKAGTSAYDQAWINAYNYNSDGFEQAQIDGADDLIIEPSYKALKEKFGIDMKKTRAREEALISTAIQYGTGGIQSIFKTINVNDNMSDTELLTKLCDEKINSVSQRFRSCSGEVQAAARNNFKIEKVELLSLAKESSEQKLNEIIVSNNNIEKDKVNNNDDNSSFSTITLNNNSNTESFKDISLKENKVSEKEKLNTVINETETKDKDSFSTITINANNINDNNNNDNKGLDNTYFTGDSYIEGISSYVKSNYSNVDTCHQRGISAHAYLNDTKSFGSAMINKIDASKYENIVLNIGINGIGGANNIKEVKQVIDKLQAKYPNKDIFVIKTTPVGTQYTYQDYQKVNQEVNQLNTEIKQYVTNKNNVYQIDASEGLVNNGILTETDDGLHISASKTNVFVKNIETEINKIKNNKNNSKTTTVTTKENDLSEEQNTIKTNAKNNNGTRPCTRNYCAAWVSGIYEKSGLGYPGLNAIDYWNYWKDSGSTSKDNIPVGAAVVGSGSGSAMGNTYGHVGIYIGNGMVADNVGRHRIISLDDWIKSQKGTCQGHHGFIGWVWPHGQALNEEETQKLNEIINKTIESDNNDTLFATIVKNNDNTSKQTETKTEDKGFFENLLSKIFN